MPDPLPEWFDKILENSPMFHQQQRPASGIPKRKPVPWPNKTSAPGSGESLSTTEKPPPIPETTLATKAFRYIQFNAYKRIFGIIFVVNLVAFIIVAVRDLSLTAIVTATSANVAIAAFARQEFFINVCFWSAGRIPKTWPLSIRKFAAKVFHYGGIHSGCGVAALVWFVLFVAKATHAFATQEQHGNVEVATMVVSYLLLGVLLATISLAHPTLRNKHHDYFDHGHKFLAYVAIALFWALLFVSAKGIRAGIGQSLGRYIVGSPTFWFTLIATLCAASPWMWLRHVDVVPEKLSSHAVRLYFNNRRPVRVAGMKIARKLTGQWHSFAVIPNEEFSSYSLLVSNAGDWTNTCIEDQPTTVWTRGYPAHGVAYVGAFFRKIVVVATGSGIGPIMALLTSKDCPPARVLWQTRNPRETYGTKILDRVHRADPEAVIVDTDTDGRMDMLELAWTLVNQSSAEAVIVVSNPKLTKQVVFGLEARGVAAYGPIFDS